MSIFNKIFRKDVTYNNFKSHEKPEFYPLFRRYIFRKTTEGVLGSNQFRRNAEFMRPNCQLQKYCHQDNSPFACLNFISAIV